MGTLLSEFRERQPSERPLANSWTPAATIERVSRRPRVLHLVNSFEAGGTERQFVELLKRLDRTRYDVRLAAIHNSGCFQPEIAPYFATIPEFPLTSFYNLNAARQLKRLRKYIRREGIEIIHAHGFYDSLFAVIAGRLAGIKVIASQRHLQLSYRRVHDWGTRAIHHLAHRLVVNSHGVRDSILARDRTMQNKIVVIHNGLGELPAPSASIDALHSSGLNIDARDELRQAARERLCSELGLHPRVKILGMVARLVPFKGHGYFLEAAAQVMREVEDIHVVLIGEGSERSAIERQAVSLGITDHVHLLGNRNDARFLVSAFDLSILSSLSEGLPNTVMEAMGAGVPVVATAIPGTMELVRDGETGFLAPPADADGLAARLLYALRHESERERVASQGRDFITSQFNIRRTVEAVEGLYQELLAVERAI
jgi:glycosyltransferase involved in cell wall biosynthesis